MHNLVVHVSGSVDWDGLMDVMGWIEDESLLSLGSKDTLSSIIKLIGILHGAILFYGNNMLGIGLYFYAPRLGIIHIYRRSFRVYWYVEAAI
jgi:hypothetical protein